MNAHSTPQPTPRPWRVVSRTQESRDVATLELEPVGGPPMSFAPGQFTMMYAFGVGEAPISISGHPRRNERLVHTVRDVGAVSHALASATPGAQFGITGPFGRPWPVHDARGGDVLVIAGGLGLAPVRPIVFEILADRGSYGYVNVLCGARTDRDLIFGDDLAAWRADPGIELLTSVDRAGPNWHGDVGVVTMLLPRTTFEPTETTAFVCGPEVMMRVVSRHLLSLGVLPERIHVSLERNMRCGVGRCGHCQLGGDFVCHDGPVFRFDEVWRRLDVREL